MGLLGLKFGFVLFFFYALKRRAGSSQRLGRAVALAERRGVRKFRVSIYGLQLE
jgi:hypothetical protein